MNEDDVLREALFVLLYLAALRALHLCTTTITTTVAHN
jgi:hypothetical protein